MKISGMVLRVKAKQFAVKFGKFDFVANEDWQSRWITRDQTKSRLTLGEKSIANSKELKYGCQQYYPRFWKSAILKIFIIQMKQDCILEQHPIVLVLCI